MQRLKELHDIFPKKNLERTKLALLVVWTVILITCIILINLISPKIILLKTLIWFFFIIFSILSILIIIIIGRILPTLRWHDYDYSPFIKTDFDFKVSDGKKQYAYFYTRKDIDIDNDPTPRPTIIGLHGWGNSHREVDKFCLPSVMEEGYLFFSFDARGQGQTPGNKNDLRQFEDTKEFIETVKNLPYVDKKRIAVIGISLGAAKASVIAYPSKDIKLVIMLSGPFDLKLTKENMGFFAKIIFILGGYRWSADENIKKKYSGINYFKSNGIPLNENPELISNSERVFLAACMDDQLVSVKNTLNAIKKLNLPKKNYRIFQKGFHTFEGNETSISTAIYHFLKEKL